MKILHLNDNYLKDQQWYAEIIGDGGFITNSKAKV